MIPLKDQMVDVDSLPGEEIEFGIGDPRWVMKTQADLYSDVTGAVVREYATNAYDANVMAGNPDPIRVTLPTLENPFYVVEDDGVGMDKPLIKTVYTQFGVSDKRDDNSTNGMLGYGSKCGVAYTTQLTVTSVRDGIKIVGIIQRKPDWRIVMKVVTEQRTDEPNGTKIVVPVHNVEEFRHKANDFFKFWLPGRVVIDGVPSAHQVGEKIMDGLYYSMDRRNSYVVMGNTPYRILNASSLFSDNRMSHINFIAYADTVKGADGDWEQAVEFTPSREDLKYTDHTKATLRKIVDDFQNRIMTLAQGEVDACANHADAFMKWQEWRGKFSGTLFNKLFYKGEQITESFAVEATQWVPNAYRRSTSYIRQYSVMDMPQTMVVTDFDPNSVSSHHKAKVRKFISDKGWRVSRFLFLKDDGSDIVSPWVPRDKFVSWEDVKEATKAPKQDYVPSNSGRIPGSWDYWTNGSMHCEEPLPVTDKPMYWVAVGESNNRTRQNINPILVLSLLREKDSVVIQVPANRKNKLLRDNPNLVHLRDYVKNKIVADPNSLVPDEVQLVKEIEYTERNWYDIIQKIGTNDPDLLKVMKALDNLEVNLVGYEHQRSLAVSANLNFDAMTIDPAKSARGLLKRRYPLIGALHVWQVDRRNRDELRIYMDAKYELLKKEGKV